MTNEELYQKIRGGDADAFEQLYEQLENFIRAIALDAARKFGCKDAAAVTLLEDLCAEGNLERSGADDPSLLESGVAHRYHRVE